MSSILRIHLLHDLLHIANTMSPSGLAAILIFVGATRAFKAYQPHCPQPPEHINYASSPTVRGTLDIVWACFAVVLTCTWAVQHLSVPVHNGFRRPRWIPSRLIKDPLLKEMTFFATKFKWMLISIAAPEFVLGKALAERWAAQESERQLDQEGWTSMHGFFANMRGFVLRFDVSAVETLLEASEPDEFSRSLHTLKPGPFADGEAPYYEQNLQRAEIIESTHRRKLPRSRPGTQIEPPTPRDNPHSPDERQKSVERNSRESILCRRRDGADNHKISIDVREPVGLGVSQHTVEDTPTNQPRRLTTNLLSPSSPSTASGTPSTPIYSPTLVETPYSPTNPQAFPNSNVTPANNTNTGLKESRSHSNDKGVTGTENEKESNVDPIWRASWALNSMQIQYAMREGIIPASPIVDHASLKDRSKGDSFIKGFAILQITALVIRIIARSFQDLATTLFEITVLAFAACAIVTYILLWHKPQDVKVPIYVDIPNTLSREQIIKLAARAPVATLLIHDFWLHGVSIRAQSDGIFPWTPGVRVRLLGMKSAMLVNPVVLGVGGGGVLFGAIHFVAWNFDFPTPVERLLWRISCAILVTFPLLGTVFYWVMQHAGQKHKDKDTKVDRSMRPLAHLISLSYLLARLYLLVEVFRSLAYPQPSVFQEVNWPTAIPYMD